MALPFRARLCNSAGFAEALGIGGFSLLAFAVSFRALQLTLPRQRVLIPMGDKNRALSLAIHCHLFSTSLSEVGSELHR